MSLIYIQFQTENNYRDVNVSKKRCGDDSVFCFLIVHIEVVRKLHSRKLVYIVVLVPFYILVLAAYCIFVLVHFGTSVVPVACILAWGSVGMPGEVLDGIPVLGHFDRLDGVPFGIVVLESGYRLALLLVHILPCQPSGIVDEARSCTLVWQLV